MAMSILLCSTPAFAITPEPLHLKPVPLEYESVAGVWFSLDDSDLVLQALQDRLNVYAALDKAESLISSEKQLAATATLAAEYSRQLVAEEHGRAEAFKGIAAIQTQQLKEKDEQIEDLVDQSNSIFRAPLFWYGVGILSAGVFVFLVKQ